MKAAVHIYCQCVRARERENDVESGKLNETLQVITVKKMGNVFSRTSHVVKGGRRRENFDIG